MHIVSSLKKAKSILNELDKDSYTIIKHPYKSRMYCVCWKGLPSSVVISAMDGCQ